MFEKKKDKHVTWEQTGASHLVHYFLQVDFMEQFRFPANFIFTNNELTLIRYQLHKGVGTFIVTLFNFRHMLYIDRCHPDGDDDGTA